MGDLEGEIVHGAARAARIKGRRLVRWPFMFFGVALVAAVTGFATGLANELVDVLTARDPLQALEYKVEIAYVDAREGEESKPQTLVSTSRSFAVGAGKAVSEQFLIVIPNGFTVNSSRAYWTWDRKKDKPETKQAISVAHDGSYSVSGNIKNTNSSLWGARLYAHLTGELVGVMTSKTRIEEGASKTFSGFFLNEETIEHDCVASSLRRVTVTVTGKEPIVLDVVPITSFEGATIDRSIIVRVTDEQIVLSRALAP